MSTFSSLPRYLATGTGWDAFEGASYCRVAVDVATAEGLLPASIYVLAEPTYPS